MAIDLSPALPTFLVTLREGVEAALVVGIVLAYLKKAGQTALNPWVYGGIGFGLGASVLVGVLFSWTLAALATSDQPYATVAKPLLEGIFCLVAIGLLSWMLVWMTQQARSLKAEVEGTVGTVLQGRQAGWGVGSLVFIAVLREGFETVLFIAARFQQGWVPVAGAGAGLLGAVGLGLLLFQWGVRINLRRFFQVMGIFLLLIVAGLVISTLTKFDRALVALVGLADRFASLCVYASNGHCILGPQVWNLASIMPDRQFPGIVFHTLFGYNDHLYLVQAMAYLLFLGTVGTFYLRSLTQSPPAPQPAPSGTDLPSGV